ncbi:MAG: acetate--CoA ligase family protein [Byssovorax sp.]
MPAVIFVAPYFTETAKRYLAATASLPGVRLGVISQEPEQVLPPELRGLFAAHFRVDDPFDAHQLVHAARWIERRLGPLHRMLAVMEQIQVPVAEAREALNLPGLHAREAHNFRDKHLMKDVLAAAGLPVARHRLVRTEDEAVRFAAEVGYPLVVKPPAGVASQSTFRAVDEAALRAALAPVEAAGGGFALLEELVLGQESSFDAFFLDDRVLFSSVSHYHPSPLVVMENPWIQGIVVVPREHDPPEQEDLRQIGARALSALGLGTGMCHLEWFRTPSGGVMISEVGARPPGAHITTIIDRAHDGDSAVAWARLMVFDRFDPFPPRRYAAGAAYLRGQGQGCVKAVHGIEQVARDIGHLVTDYELPHLGWGRGPAFDGDGFILLRHPETRVVEEALRHIIETVRVELG